MELTGFDLHDPSEQNHHSKPKEQGQWIDPEKEDETQGLNGAGYVFWMLEEAIGTIRRSWHIRDVNAALGPKTPERTHRPGF